MKKHFLYPIFILVCALSIVGCVSKKKYMQSQTALESLRKDSSVLAGKLADQEILVNELKESASVLQQNMERLKQQLDLTSKEAVAKIATQQTLLTKNREELSYQQKKLDAIQNVLDQQKFSPLVLKEKIMEAFAAIHSSDLSISAQKGKISITMPQTLLFAPGSSVIHPQAKEALSKLAAFLITEPDIKVNIEAYTDSISLSTLFDNKFDLCKSRTNYIVKYFINEQKLNANRIMSAEPAFYHQQENEKPLTSQEGNQVTKIILTPKFYEVYELLNGG